MTDNALEQAQRLVDQLTPQDQVWLLAYVASRVALRYSTLPPGSERPETVDVWQKFFELGEELADTDAPACNTLTEAVLAMRR